MYEMKNNKNEKYENNGELVEQVLRSEPRCCSDVPVLGLWPEGSYLDWGLRMRLDITRDEVSTKLFDEKSFQKCEEFVVNSMII